MNSSVKAYFQIQINHRNRKSISSMKFKGIKSLQHASIRSKDQFPSKTKNFAKINKKAVSSYNLHTVREMTHASISFQAKSIKNVKILKVLDTMQTILESRSRKKFHRPSILHKISKSQILTVKEIKENHHQTGHLMSKERKEFEELTSELNQVVSQTQNQSSKYHLLQELIHLIKNSEQTLSKASNTASLFEDRESIGMEIKKIQNQIVHFCTITNDNVAKMQIDRQKILNLRRERVIESVIYRDLERLIKKEETQYYSIIIDSIGKEESLEEIKHEKILVWKKSLDRRRFSKYSNFFDSMSPSETSALPKDHHQFINVQLHQKQIVSSFAVQFYNHSKDNHFMKSRKQIQSKKRILDILQVTEQSFQTLNNHLEKLYSSLSYFKKDNHGTQFIFRDILQDCFLNNSKLEWKQKQERCEKIEHLLLELPRKNQQIQQKIQQISQEIQRKEDIISQENKLKKLKLLQLTQNYEDQLQEIQFSKEKFLRENNSKNEETINNIVLLFNVESIEQSDFLITEITKKKNPQQNLALLFSKIEQILIISEIQKDKHQLNRSENGRSTNLTLKYESQCPIVASYEKMFEKIQVEKKSENNKTLKKLHKKSNKSSLCLFT